MFKSGWPKTAAVVDRWLTEQIARDLGLKAVPRKLSDEETTHEVVDPDLTDK